MVRELYSLEKPLRLTQVTGGDDRTSARKNNIQPSSEPQKTQMKRLIRRAPGGFQYLHGLSSSAFYATAVRSSEYRSTRHI